METKRYKPYKTKTGYGDLMCKGCKLKHVQRCLQSALEFLKDYLPLANAHSNEFLTNNIWESFLPEDIRNELCSMPDENLIDFSSYFERLKIKDSIDLDIEKRHGEIKENVFDGRDCDYYITAPGSLCEVKVQESRGEKDISQGDSRNGVRENKCHCKNGPENWTFECPYLDGAPKINNRSKLVRGFPPNWVHKDIFSFLYDSKLNTLETLNVVSSLKDLYLKLNVSDVEDKIFISHIMTTKKSHEVDVMGDVCCLLAKRYGIDTVVDMGSGKGYLSTQLALQHKLVVIGIDAVQTNTSGAQKRADKLGKHWNGLVRNATEDKNRGYKIKRSKKWKKKMKLAAVKGDNSFKLAKVEKHLNEDKDEDFPDFQGLFDSIDGKEENSGLDCGNLDKESFTSEPLNQLSSIREFSKLTNVDDLAKVEVSNTIGGIELKSLYATQETEVKGIVGNLNVASFSDSDVLDIENSEKRCQKVKPKEESEKLFPLTMFVDVNVNLNEVVDKALKGGQFYAEKKCPRDRTLMLTGLHTCGGLGSSILQLFVNNPQAKVLCSVGCCYHLMEEEFVCAPFENGDRNIEGTPGFPLSKFLRDQKVGLGRLARNFASQSITRMAKETELKSKAFPRSLLQKIILDVIGYTEEDWKGIRKLDQKCENMFEYVHKAFCKFGLPTDKLTPELVSEYVEKYKGEERKLAMFHNLKTMIAPCIEAVVILDRICYLLEQDNVADVDLVQLFDPVVSPRCYGIIAFKDKLSLIERV